MKYKGNTQIRISQISWAILGCIFLPLYSYGVLYQVEQLSNPAGFVSDTEAIEGGTTKQSINPTLSSNGYAFGYWAINGVRQAGEDNRSLTQVSTTISANTTFTAHYYSESADTDTDGIMDWYEYRMFGDLSQGPTDNPDGDGFNNKRESELGQDPLIVDEVEWGGVSGRLSTGFTYADTSMVLAVVKSDPAGFVSEISNYLEENSTVTTSSLHGATNGYNFAYWSVNGVRQAGPTGVSLSKVSQDVNATTTIIAHYKPSNEDSDSDGVMDWFELYQFGSLDLGPTDDPDGDGFSNKHESELGQEATIVDTVEWGGISGRLSTGFTYADTSMVLAVVKSDPAGFVTETSNYLEENSTVTTSSLHGATNGYNFAYWSVNGVRQEGPTGVSLSKVATDVNATTNIVAHYKPSNEDSDSDGVMDWFELYQFGDLNQSGTDDPDGDGFSNKREGELGQEATIVDSVEWGGVSGRLSTGILYFQQQNRPPSNLELNNTIVFLNKDANQTVGAFTPTDPDDPGRVRTYTYQLLGGAGGEDNNKFNLLGRNLRASQTLTSEGNFSIQVRVRDDENASFDKNFTILAIHDPNKDDDGDGLTYAQEQALGTSDTKADTDGDGFGDLQEKVAGSDPTDANDIIDLNTGLMGHWPLDGNASDISGNDRHGIIQGATASLDRHGWENRGMYFDGSIDRIYVNGPWISGNSPRTVSIWGKSEGLQANFFSLGKGATQGDRFSLLGQTNTTSIKFIGQNNGKTFSTPSYHNLWKHFVLTYDGSLGKFYVNKNQIGSFNLGLNTDGTVPFVIGSGPAYKNSEFFKGTLDEVRVYSRVLSGTEVADLYDLESVAPNRPPRDLNSTAVLAFQENQPIGTVIGEFNATDPDGDAITYHFVNGENNNSFFTLDTNGSLKTATTFDYESNASSYAITVQVKDQHSATTEGNFTVTLLDVYEDTDGDGFRDSLEASTGSNLSDPASTPLQQGLVAWYPFDGNASDMSGNGNHGTVNGATLGTDYHGKLNCAYSFDGLNNYIEINSSETLSFSDEISLSFWMKPTKWGIDNTKLAGVISKKRSDSHAGFVTYHDYTRPGKLNYRFKGTSSAKGYLPSVKNVQTNFWEHWVITQSTSKVILHCNGQQEASHSISNAGLISSDDPLHIGNAQTWNATSGDGQGNTYFQGFIDDIRIYDRALSANEINVLYNYEKPKLDLNDSNFQDAVNLWFSDELNATWTYGHISDWNVSAVTDMSNAFKDRTDFNVDIGGWDVSNAISTYRMFYAASSFNQDIGNWNVGNVSDMRSMFQGASAFNQPIGGWNVSKVQHMFGVFAGASCFNQPIGDWNTSSVTNMHNFFNGATAFNQPLNDWNTSAVTNFYGIFSRASNFNQPLEKWDTASVTQFNRAFYKTAFNQDLSDWNISSATSMSEMFTESNALSNDHKGLIHKTFSSNSNWPYDWAVFIPPTDLNSTAVLAFSENQPLGTIVGEFNATDPDANATLKYTLVDGNGSTGNLFFNLDQNGTLKSAAVFDYENNESNYSIRVQVRDEQNASLEKTFVINLLNEIEDLDGDGIEDFHDPDDDNDGFSDAVEIAYGSDPTDANSTANAAPTDLNNSTSASFFENQPIGTLITDFNATDPDVNATLTYSISGPNAHLFTIDQNGTLFTHVIFDFETNASVYNLSVRVTDEHNASQQISRNIILKNINESPNSLSLSSNSLLENQPVGTVIGEFNATDLEGDAITFHLPGGDNNNYLFTLDTNGTLKTTTTFDYESNASTYTITVQAKDELNATTEGNFTVTLLNENERPYNLKSSADLQVKENEAIGTHVGQLTAKDMDHNSSLFFTLVAGAEDNHLFRVDTNGTLYSTATFDFETNSSFQIRAKVRDKYNLWIKQNFIINVLDVVEDFDKDGVEDHFDIDDDNDGFSDEKEIAYGSDPFDPKSVANAPPVITLKDEYPEKVDKNGVFHIRIPENQTDIIQVIATDLDKDDLNFSIYGWQDLEHFEINATTGNLRFKHVPNFEKPRDHDTDNKFGIVLRVSDGKAHQDQPVYIHVENQNEAPFYFDAIEPLRVLENQPIGTIVGELEAIDDDEGDLVTYQLLKDRDPIANESFTLGENGKLRTAEVLDYENNASLFIRAKATDKAGLLTMKRFVVEVINVVEDLDGDGKEDAHDDDIDGDGFSNEEELAYGSDPFDRQSVVNVAPNDITIQGGEVEENQPAGTLVARFFAVDADKNNTFSYQLIDSVNKELFPFKLSQRGGLRTIRSLDYESDPHEYSQTIRVMDDLNESFDKSFTIHLTNKVEDIDGDGIEDAYDEDRDGDGFSNEEEIEEGTDPNNQYSHSNKPILQTQPGVIDENGSIYLSGSVLADGKGRVDDFGFVISSGISIDPEKSKVYWVRGVGDPSTFKLKVTQSPFEPIMYFRAWAKNTAGYGIGPVKKVRIPEAPKPWWGDVQERSGGWKTSDWFGNFIFYEKGWLYHAHLGWLYSSPAKENSVWLWRENQGWLWTKEGVWPYLWSDQTGNWLYIVQSKPGEPIRFYDYSSDSYR